MNKSSQKKNSVVFAKSVTDSIQHIAVSRQTLTSSSLAPRIDGANTGTSFFSRIKEAKTFEVSVAFVIVANACTIGFEADWRIKNTNINRESPPWLETTEWIFLCFFLLELAVRVLAEGAKFISPRNPVFGWNAFDSLVTSAAILERLAINLPINFLLARLCRVMRLARMLRFIKLLRACRELRVIAMGIMNCGRTLLWSFLILVVFTYMYSVMVLNLISDWLHDTAENSGAGYGDDQVTSEFIGEKFGSLLAAMYTLYAVALDGFNWGTVCDPLFNINLILPVSFVVYITVIFLVVLNIITATFVQSAAQVAVDSENKFLDVLDDKKVWLQRVSDMFKACGGQGPLEPMAFRQLMDSPEAKMLFSEVGMDLDHHKFGELFHLFDVDGDGAVDVNEFAHGLSMLGGSARSLDMFRQFKRLGSKVDDLLRRMQDSQVAAASGARPDERHVWLSMTV